LYNPILQGSFSSAVLPTGGDRSPLVFVVIIVAVVGDLTMTVVLRRHEGQLAGIGGDQ
jgi:hypothetical protein